MPEQSICKLDVLPGRCSLEAEGVEDRVRFRGKDAEGRYSLWSGWFPVADAPIELTWRIFEWPHADDE